MNTVLDQQKVYRCEVCLGVCNEVQSVLDEEANETLWVCESCSHKYEIPSDPDCMID